MRKQKQRKHIGLRERLKPLPRWMRALIYTLFVVVVIGVVSVGALSFRIYRANLKELKGDLPSWGEISSDERILVVAPHSDDETLGCGAVIRDAVKANARVQVVVVTNGDAFGSMVRKLERAGPRTYISYGRKRQKESLTAMRVLGLQDQDVTFLGYPDKGIFALWTNNWTPDNLYESKYTRCSTSPYDNSFRKDAPYCGRALLADLESVILAFRPTTIFYPHPSDHHTDHLAVYCFVQQAIHELRLRSEVRQGKYLAHRGGWPVPEGFHPKMALAPPASLTNLDMEWFVYPVTKENVALKLEAIRCYKTQLTYNGEYLYSFDRTNELFSTYYPAEIPFISTSKTPDPESVWERIDPGLVDPVGDGVNVGFTGKGGDIRAIKCYYDEQNVHVRVELAKPHSRLLTYSVLVFGLPDATAARITVMRDLKSRTNRDGTTNLSGNTFDVTVPIDKLGKWDALMVCADSSFENRKIDRTAWRIMMPTGNGATRRPNPPAVDRPVLRTPLAPARKGP